ncbi:MAG: hypothetical protein GQ531_04820 [Sulfurovum sp.]|nr:hypothetical protein [Sulfurovum sp.]
MTTRKSTNLFLAFLALFVFSGCIGSSSSYYVLSVASQPSHVYARKNKVIAVQKVSVPGYLFKREIAVASSSSQISFLGASWGEDLDEGLTNRLIGFLQKKFNQPTVYHYPWGLDNQPDIKVAVNISRFIAQNGVVYLDASWSLESFKRNKRVARLFSTSVATQSDATHIVNAMDQAFARFEESVAQGISQF